ncbi:hypothetical protein DACRYDRAFT_119105 [Dacryopinax primogenitus]|uniref:Dihydrofolate reductase n=1 Tax=Dacryopinax primogenitus (strain DJM 731) TaxID=1858805 RepID=M5FQR6_DACPD|nr:uncharacterized protein DACRYDRAFT_119105 [Dacryopinax primogenitus]EJT97908.1 hypothetical protein DACRYDRAFT_119105 [Dacryopinax primogenitus]
MMNLPPLTMIVAATQANGIGISRTNTLPWRLPREMAYFARITSAAPEGKMNAVVMGRNTWESIPEKFRPLKGRWNVVLSSREMPHLIGIPNTVHLASLSDLGSVQPPKPIYRFFIIGGAALYKSLISHPSFDRILMTRVVSPDYEECDVFFPDILESSEALPGAAKQQSEAPAPEDTGKASQPARWTKASHAELQAWAAVPVPEGIQEEKGTKYDCQMWVYRWYVTVFRP